jgi:two-component system sensor histidine kinase YesM
MYITLPVKKLSDIMKVDRKGSSPVTLIDNDNERSDEIGDLYNCYNAMGARINDLLETVVEKEKQRVHAEMIAVQEQMNPHFLYNTLDTIGCMAFQNSPEEVYDAIETLGVFYRKFLSKGSEAITVSDEVTIVQKYIKLLKLRNDAEFTDEYYIEPGLENVMVTKLILQPLVENSIQHGIIPKGEPGVIRISIYSENNRMHIKVYDSGVGMDEYQTAALLKDDNPKSFGFKSTVKRIRSFYQNNAFVSINSKVGEFCEIDINVPCHR